MFQMMLYSDNQAQLEAAIQLVCLFWDTSLPLFTRNQVLLGLLDSVQKEERADWCIAVLRLACYPALLDIQKVAVRWSNTLSAFSHAIYDLKLDEELGKNLKTRLKTRAKAHASMELERDASEAKLRDKLTEKVEQSSLGEVLSGDSADPLAGITREQATCMLLYFARKKKPLIREQDIKPLLRKLFPTKKAATPRERQQKHRALQRMKTNQPVTKPTTRAGSVPTTQENP